MLIYQIFLGRWEMANVRDHKGQVLQRLQDYDWKQLSKIGVTHVYLLGLFDTGFHGEWLVKEEEGYEIAYEDYKVSSPFAITNHKKVLPDLGTKTDFKQLLKVIKEAGLQVLLDFVPNHTSIYHEWVDYHPKYYKRTKDRKLVREFSGEVAKLNYSNKELAEEMIDVVREIMKLGVSGVRVDMAHLVPKSFWEECIGQIKQEYPKALFIAEAYVSDLFNMKLLEDLSKLGFDAIYHEPLYRNIVQYQESKQNNNESLADVVAHINYAFDSSLPIQWMNYVFNHDNTLPMEHEFSEALHVIALILYGDGFLFNGSLHGLEHRIPHHYLEPLAIGFNDIETISNNLKKILEMRVKGVFNCTYAREVSDCLVLGSEKSQAYINLSNERKYIQQEESLGLGLLHGLDGNDFSLASGEFEVFEKKPS